jgi:hypothetical protein
MVSRLRISRPIKVLNIPFRISEEPRLRHPGLARLTAGIDFGGAAASVRVLIVERQFLDQLGV